MWNYLCAAVALTLINTLWNASYFILLLTYFKSSSFSMEDSHCLFMNYDIHLSITWKCSTSRILTPLLFLLDPHSIETTVWSILKWFIIHLSQWLWLIFLKLLKQYMVICYLLPSLLLNRREREQGRKQGSKGINVIQVDLGLQADRRHFLVHSNTDCIHVMHMGERLQIFSKTDGQTNWMPLPVVEWNYQIWPSAW